MKAVLIAVDGILCDWRQRQHLSGAPEFFKREVMMKDAPTPESVRCLQELSQRYKLVYLTARPEAVKAATEEWLNTMNFPKGPLFLGTTPADRLALAPALREQLSLLDRSVHRGFPDHEDQVQAETGDSLGVGGAR